MARAKRPPNEELKWPKCPVCKSTNTTGRGGEGKRRTLGKIFAICKDCTNEWQICGGLYQYDTNKVCGKRGRALRANGRCKNCGGDSPGAPIIHGERSQFRDSLPEFLRSGYDAAVADPKITSQVDSLRTIDARIRYHYEQIRDGKGEEGFHSRKIDRLYQLRDRISATEIKREEAAERNLNDRQANFLVLQLIGANSQALEDAIRESDIPEEQLRPFIFAFRRHLSNRVTCALYAATGGRIGAPEGDGKRPALEGHAE